ncbi:hypothetical protein GCM10009632_36200 [Mycolicibacterium alvei]|uniref:Uncharacterized protein n=1 Tax=Mycolicibacterium alvei TaxID=67081 RepID=A0A6N4URJ3_9MYCO|nr:hypothetical protein MALV_16180 [Mycolicibacterium alvei]
MGGHRCGRGLLQRLVGEQPAVGVVELGCGPAPQLHGLHQNCGTVTELCSDSSDIADQAGSGEAAPGHLTQGLLPRLRPQVRDVGGIERYDGLTPVTITL